MTDQVPELLPCPFCGESGKYTYHRGSCPESRHGVTCSNWKCPSKSAGGSTKQQMADQWNIRADLDNPNGPQFKRMREALQEVVTLIEELCDAVDCEAEDVGGGQRPSLVILQDIGPRIVGWKARTALASSEAD